MRKREKIIHAIVRFLMKFTKVTGIFLTNNKISVDINYSDVELVDSYESILWIESNHGRRMQFR